MTQEPANQQRRQCHRHRRDRADHDQRGHDRVVGCLDVLQVEDQEQGDRHAGQPEHASHECQASSRRTSRQPARRGSTRDGFGCLALSVTSARTAASSRAIRERTSSSTSREPARPVAPSSAAASTTSPATTPRRRSPVRSAAPAGHRPAHADAHPGPTRSARSTWCVPMTRPRPTPPISAAASTPSAVGRASSATATTPATPPVAARSAGELGRGGPASPGRQPRGGHGQQSQQPVVRDVGVDREFLGQPLATGQQQADGARRSPVPSSSP
jgi:hypothetical protein